MSGAERNKDQRVHGREESTNRGEEGKRGSAGSLVEQRVADLLRGYVTLRTCGSRVRILT